MIRVRVRVISPGRSKLGLLRDSRTLQLSLLFISPVLLPICVFAMQVNDASRLQLSFRNILMSTNVLLPGVPKRG